jgi:hypothetical protein
VSPETITRITRHTLRVHPDTISAAVRQIEVDVARPRAGRLILTYAVTGKIGDIAMPPVADPVRADELWQHTCFEAFLRSSSSAGYYEFNFAPSTQWAAYRFSDYRTGRCVATEIGAPLIGVESSADRYALRASVAIDRLQAPSASGGGIVKDQTWRLGLSAIIEEKSGGQRSYWALTHPPGKADFHHSDCFALEVT